MRLDLYLAARTWRELRSGRHDIVWAGSEKLGIPLALLPLRQPLVVIVHHAESPWKARLLRWSGLHRRWSGIGYVAPQSRDFMMRSFGLPADRFFPFISAELDRFRPSGGPCPDGPILSLGVAKRDYATLLDAVDGLPDCPVEIYAASRYGDRLRERRGRDWPAGVRFMDWVPEDALTAAYEGARFVVIPLEPTTHAGAGATVALEAMAAGKAIIASDTGGMRSFLRDGETGVLVPPGDARALREAIETLSAAPERASTMGMAGRRLVEDSFDPVRVHAQTLAFLKRIHQEQGATA